MDNTIRLFGLKTKGDWINLRTRILADPNDDIWPETIDLLNQRLKTRYFKPIARILGMDLETGEGFAAMTLVCSLLEFLQSCYEGRSFVLYAQPTRFVYGSSSAEFKSFLEQHAPFQTVFLQPVSAPTNHIQTYADDFYKQVRCGLLHEAATGSGWTIRSTSSSSTQKPFVDVSDENNKIIYREIFVTEIENYCKAYYKKITDNENDQQGYPLRDNLCRKFDSLCMIDDKTVPWWQ